MILIDGKKEAAELREKLKQEVLELKSKYNKVPGLTVILIGELAPSKIYVKNKEKSANEVGLKSEVIRYPETVDEKTEELPIKTNRTSTVVVGSRSHPSVETAKYFEKLKKKYGQIELVSMGSSLKICLVAEGKADIYPRFAPTMEWDTAAGHAIANGAGKTLIDVSTNNEMIYNRKQLRNNWFIVK